MVCPAPVKPRGDVWHGWTPLTGGEQPSDPLWVLFLSSRTAMMEVKGKKKFTGKFGAKTSQEKNRFHKNNGKIAARNHASQQWWPLYLEGGLVGSGGLEQMAVCIHGLGLGKSRS